MIIETSTANVMLGVLLTSFVALQVWIVRELGRLSNLLTRMAEHCPYCKPKIHPKPQLT